MTNIGTSELPAADSIKPSGDIRRLKEHSALSVDELREFLAKMRGKSPQEVLGMVASSDLLRATVQATIGCIVLLAVTTVGPYFLYSGAPKPAPSVVQKPQANAPQANAAAPTAPAANASEKKSDTATTTTTTVATNPNQPNMEKAAKKMGMDETKITDPKKNPLENNLDKLLDKLE